MRWKKQQLGIAERNPTSLWFLVLNNRYSVSPNINKQKTFSHAIIYLH